MKHYRLTVSLGALLVAGQATPVAGREAPNRVSWAELPGVVNGRTVSLNLPSGPAVEGRVLGVEQDALVLQVKKTSDKAAIAKGEARIPRASVNTLLVKTMRVRGRVAGTTTGVLLGGPLALAVAFGCSWGGHCSVARDAAQVGFLVGLPVAGYYLGRLADRKYTLITILPDATRAEGYE